MSIDFANALYEQSIKSKPQTIEEIIAQKNAIEKQEFKNFKQRIAKRKKELLANIKKETLKYSCLHFHWVKYESFEQEQEYWEIENKRLRELTTNYDLK